MKTKRIITKLKLEKFSENEWGLIYPKEITDSIDEFNYALETLQTSPEIGEVLMKRLADKFPNDHLEAYLYLGHYFEGLSDKKLCKQNYYQAYLIAKAAIPAEFNQKIHRIPWSVLENRSLLRSNYNWALQSMYFGNINKASKILKFIIYVNPIDNQGARYLLNDCYFLQEKHKSVLSMFKKYEDDHSPEYYYGLGLIYYKQSSLEKATQFLQKGIEYFPNVVLELISRSKNFPEKEYLSSKLGTISGGEVEAYEYREHNLEYWENTKGALKFLYDLIPGIK